MKIAGSVYILINNAIEGLVKIGRTERDSQERAKELSAATGVPSPFRVAFDSYFEDSIAAEMYIHASLELKGYRLTNNKEFFNCPLNEAIKTMIEAEQHFKGTKADNITEESTNDESLINREQGEPWKESLQLAIAHYYGENDFLQDHEKAFKFFKQSFKLGSVEACVFLGDMYKDGVGVSLDLNDSLRYYEEGAKRGDGSCFAYMAMTYHQLEHFDNAQKCWNKYFESKGFEENIKSERARMAWRSFECWNLERSLLSDSPSWSIENYKKAFFIAYQLKEQFYNIRDEIILYGNKLLEQAIETNSNHLLHLDEKLAAIKRILAQKWKITITEFNAPGFKGIFRRNSMRKIIKEMKVADDDVEADRLLSALPVSFEVSLPEYQLGLVKSRIEDTGARIEIQKV